jgi:hypothetical protein
MSKKKLNQVPYFKKVEEGDKIFGMVFGPGVVTSVWGDGHYSFEVEYDNGDIVPYTDEGFPGWGVRMETQTCFYKEDIDIMDLDMSPVDEILNPKKIIKLRAKGKLEGRCPSGLWRNVNDCPQHISEKYLENEQFHLFRKQR